MKISLSKYLAYCLFSFLVSSSPAIAMQSMESLGQALDNAYDHPPAYKKSQGLVDILPDDGADLVYVEQFGYVTATGNVNLRTGLVSACVVMALYNQKTQTGTMIHLSAENYGYLMAALMSAKALPNYNLINTIIENMGGATEVQAQLVGGNENAISLWQKYLKQSGIENITVHFYPQWTNGAAQGATADEVLNHIKTAQLTKGFVQLCCATGNIAVTQNGDQFVGHISFVGQGPQNVVLSIASNEDLVQFYQTQNNNSQWHKNLRVWGMWPGSKYMDQSCAQCGAEQASNVCSQCKLFHYCSPTCQRTHWSKHKFNCRK